MNMSFVSHSPHHHASPVKNNLLSVLQFKCWYYDTAIADGNEDRLKNLKPEDMPEDVRKAWKNAHR